MPEIDPLTVIEVVLSILEAVLMMLRDMLQGLALATLITMVVEHDWRV